MERDLTPAGLGQSQLVDVQLLCLTRPDRGIVDAAVERLQFWNVLGDRAEQPHRPPVVDDNPPIDDHHLVRRRPLHARKRICVEVPAGDGEFHGLAESQPAPGDSVRCGRCPVPPV